jgi:hypothetical protein
MFSSTLDCLIEEEIKKNPKKWYQIPTMKQITQIIHMDYDNVIFYKNGFFSATSKYIPDERGLYCATYLHAGDVIGKYPTHNHIYVPCKNNSEYQINKVIKKYLDQFTVLVSNYKENYLYSHFTDKGLFIVDPVDDKTSHEKYVTLQINQANRSHDVNCELVGGAVPQFVCKKMIVPGIELLTDYNYPEICKKEAQWSQL